MLKIAVVVGVLALITIAPGQSSADVLGRLTASGNTTKVVTMDASSPATNDCAKFDASDNLTTSGAPCGGAGASPGGSSGDIQYNNAGAFGGRAPSGNGTSVVTTTGAQTSGRCVQIDANGNHTAAAAACGSGGGGSAYNISGGTSTITTAATYIGSAMANATSAGANPIPVDTSGTASGLICSTSAAAGSGITWTFTLIVNGSANTNQQASVTGTSATVTSTVTDVGVALVRGDLLTVQWSTSSGTPTFRANCRLKVS